MAGINWRNMALRILSVLLALLLWIFATNEQNPVNDQILSIQIERRNPPKDMVIGGNIPTHVSIRVQGPRTQVSSLTAADFQAVLDLSEIGEGDHYVPLKVNSPPGIQVAQVTPSRINVLVERIIEKQVDVAVALKGTPAKGFAARDAVIQPSKVTVKGPRSKVNAIDQIKVTVDVESSNVSVDQMFPVITGQNGVSVSPQAVKVTLPISPLPSKTVPVKTKVTGEPAPGCEISEIAVNPAGVQLLAPSGVLAGINAVETDSIDVKGADRDFTIRVGLSQPTGVVELKPSTVEVTVKIKKKDQEPAPGTAPR